MTILEGATFCVSDEFGDIGEPTTGFFDADTRFLSRFCLTVNGARPLLLSHGKVEYYSAAWFLRNPPAGGLAHDEVSIARRRFVGDGMQDHIILVRTTPSGRSSSSSRSSSAATSPTSSPSRRFDLGARRPGAGEPCRARARLLRRARERVRASARRTTSLARRRCSSPCAARSRRRRCATGSRSSRASAGSSGST